MYQGTCLKDSLRLVDFCETEIRSSDHWRNHPVERNHECWPDHSGNLEHCWSYRGCGNIQNSNWINNSLRHVLLILWVTQFPRLVKSDVSMRQCFTEFTLRVVLHCQCGNRQRMILSG